MATALKLRSDIKKLKKALETKGISDSVKSKLKSQLNKAEAELETMKAGKTPKKSSVKGTKTALTSLQKLVKGKRYSVYQGSNVDLKKDAGEGALPTGRRISKGLKSNQFGKKGSNKGNVYYEYRANRLDVKQPKKAQKYPKLEGGGKIEDSDYVAVAEKDGYWYIISMPSTKEMAQAQIDLGVPKGHNGKVVTVGEAKAHKKVLGLEYLVKKESGGYMADGGEIKAGDYVIVDNPHWKASMGVEKAVRRKVKMVADDNVFFHDGSNSSMKYVKKLASGGYMAKGGELNLKVRKMAKEYGLTPDKLGRDYEMTMAQAAVESLTDANYHGAARKLVSILENKPEWAADPYKQANVPDFNSPDYSKWRDSSVYSSEYWDADDNTSEFARKVATEAGWDGYEIANAYQYLVRMDGGAHKLAEKIKKAMEEDDMQGGAHQPKFQVDDVVFNKKTKTIGIVRMEDDKHGEVKTDADGNVDVDELEYYNPLMHPEHGEGKAAPSTAKEIESRGLWKPFAKRAEKGGYMAEGGIISKTHKLG